MDKTRSLNAILLGLLIAVAAALLAELVSGPGHGHRIDVDALPHEAKAILAERPGTPISSEQWQRLDKVMAKSGGWPGGRHVFLASVRASWYWFLALPVAALLLWRHRTSLSGATVGLVFAPSLLLLASAYASAPATGLLR